MVRADGMVVVAMGVEAEAEAARLAGLAEELRGWARLQYRHRQRGLVVVQNRVELVEVEMVAE